MRISGFTRVVGGVLGTDEAQYQGYDNNFSLSSFSLAAVQADYAFTDNLKGSAQVLYHSSEIRQSGVEWLYLSYEPVDAIQIKAGRLRTPVLLYSDVQDVGYAYPWAIAPQQLYSAYLFSRYEGANLRYRFAWDSIQFELEGYWGHFDDDIKAADLMLNVHVENLNGFIASADFGNGVSLRLATMDAPEIEVETAQLELLRSGLLQAGFTDLAEQLSLGGGATALISGASYQGLEWFAAAEWMYLNSDIEVLAELQAYYFTLGRYLGEFQIFATVADSSYQLNTIENSIPLGVAPGLDQLYFGVEQLKQSLPTDELFTLSLGARWDFRPSMALKAEITWLDGEPGQSSFYDVTSIQDGFDRDTTLYQVAWEWVF
ncbi:TonB-dependent receptor [Salinimonas lutimaris]|uniref:hypothetical protein n=1 Tax=Salinimonas lutimaris TaxID=914153 RepID=UPI001586936E|nr:hypothetical protein [Salinimonas lutimaris]